MIDIHHKMHQAKIIFQILSLEII